MLLNMHFDYRIVHHPRYFFVLRWLSMVLILGSIMVLASCNPSENTFPAGEIFTFAINPTGEYLAVGGAQGVYYYRLSDLQLIWSKGTDDAVESLAFNPTGEQLLGRLADKVDTVLLWKAKNGRQLRKWALDFSTPQTTPVNWSPDGVNVLLERDADDILLLNTSTNQPYTLEREEDFGVGTGRHDILFDSAWSPDGDWLAFGTYDSTIELWDVDGNTLVSILPTAEKQFVTGVAFDPTGMKLASNSFDRKGLVWDIRTRTILLELEEPSSLYLNRQTSHRSNYGGLVWSVDGKWLVSGTQTGALVVWDATTGTITRFLTGHTGPVVALGLRPVSGTLISASSNEIIEWSLASGERLPTFEGLVSTP